MSENKANQTVSLAQGKRSKILQQGKAKAEIATAYIDAEADAYSMIGEEMGMFAGKSGAGSKAAAAVAERVKALEKETTVSAPTTPAAAAKAAAAVAGESGSAAPPKPSSNLLSQSTALAASAEAAAEEKSKRESGNSKLLDYIWYDILGGGGVTGAGGSADADGHPVGGTGGKVMKQGPIAKQLFVGVNPGTYIGR